MEKLNSSRSTQKNKQLRQVKSGVNLEKMMNYEEETNQTKSTTSIKIISAPTEQK